MINYFVEKYDCDCIDGVRIKFNHGWGLVRASNTQPVLVCRFEANSNKELKEIETIVMSQINKYITL